MDNIDYTKLNPPEYPIGSEVYVISFFNDEPDSIGVVVAVNDCLTHYYYEVVYADTSGRNMKCGCAAKHIRGLAPRREIDITPRTENVILFPTRNRGLLLK